MKYVDRRADEAEIGDDAAVDDGTVLLVHPPAAGGKCGKPFSGTAAENVIQERGFPRRRIVPPPADAGKKDTFNF
jgi:hypothetical protein